MVKTFLNQPIKNELKTYEHIRTIAAGQWDDHKTGCLLDYYYFKDYYKMTAIDLSKQHVLDTGPRAIQQINFTAKETVLDFSQGAE